MIYLGDQFNALNEYSKVAVCWLGVKLKGRNTYNCGDSTCVFCNGNGKKRSGLDQDFRNLFTDSVIHELVTAKPIRLFQLHNILLTEYVSIPGKTVNNFKRYCKLLFVDSGYTNWFLKEKKNYWLANLLDQHTCTYCNREYIFIYKNKAGGKGMVPQFDHWFAKTDYPLLGLSFYNLIPSCATCNAIKSTTTFNLVDHLHPYVDTNISSSYMFSYLPISVTNNQLIFKNNSLFNFKGLDTVSALNLPLIYEGHSTKELQDLIDLRYKYSDNYLNILLEKTFGHLDIPKEERYRLIFGIELEEEKYHKRIFSKFKNDIIKELLSINN
ncbi:hypothetical protein BTO05_10975 [Winogradskyella sp. PC-19]|uniref:hypothetical protein n=1 Tax=Winogradskyella sp. PC-19 TaxID=754417 RepID=UPI000B3C3137|nr:hypothetical protein [Winogradskyella sp. PC-19]ARV10133.1 hypothetical protein BTO05_10975 [Winogradskyella sp. PC-19]